MGKVYHGDSRLNSEVYLQRTGDNNMGNATNLLTPQKFWEVYSKKINEAAQKDKSGFYEKYKNNPEWTKEIIEIAKQTIGQLLSGQEVKGESELRIDPEYFNVDLIGYITQWPENKRKEKLEKQHVWNLKVAYEHENLENWSYELCKLCYIAADLRVIHSYINTKRKKMEDILQGYVDELKHKEIITRTKNNWLFIFGTLGEHSKAHRAFTLDPEFKVIQVKDGEEVIPENWKPTTNK